MKNVMENVKNYWNRNGKTIVRFLKCFGGGVATVGFFNWGTENYKIEGFWLGFWFLTYFFTAMFYGTWQDGYETGLKEKEKTST